MRGIGALGAAAMMVMAASAAHAGLQAGVGRASINPMEADIPTQLGGYGEREGKPATGTHDTLWAKALVLEFAGQRAAIVSLDVCHIPRGAVEDAIAKAAVPGLTYANTLMCASHTHAGLEGMSMDRRNIANNPHIGLFDERVLEFVSARIAEAIAAAGAQLQPVSAGAGAHTMPGMNRNRRDASQPTDETMTVLRLDDAAGRPFAVLVNYAAHETIMTPEIMEVSSGWPGTMQRTVEDLIGGGAACLYVNGAEGDVAPAGYTGGSRFEMADGYGRRMGIAAARAAEAIRTKPVSDFRLLARTLELPDRKAAPDFLKIAGDEYQVSPEQLDMLLGVLFPDAAPFYGLRIDDFAMITFPGEPITAIGMTAKAALRAGGIGYATVGALTNDLIGYILTSEEYAKSGYEVTASFYGPELGPRVDAHTAALAAELTAR